jgi:hypothetical protein
VVPILPLFFLLLLAAATHLRQGYQCLGLALACASFLINLPSGFVNWHEASLANSAALWTEQIRYHWAPAPRQQLAIWNGFIDGLEGRPLASNPEWLKDTALFSVVAFPDLWTFKLMRLSGGGVVAGLLISCSLVCGCFFAASKILRKAPQAAPLGRHRPE